jgi:hypothetical protein
MVWLPEGTLWLHQRAASFLAGLAGIAAMPIYAQVQNRPGPINQLKMANRHSTPSEAEFEEFQYTAPKIIQI